MKNNLVKIFCALSLTCGFASCTDYLDKSPDTDVSAEQAFKNFTNFQGYVEEMYNCIPSLAPSAAAVTICRSFLVLASPAAKIPGTEVIPSSSALI